MKRQSIPVRSVSESSASPHRRSVFPGFLLSGLPGGALLLSLLLGNALLLVSFTGCSSDDDGGPTGTDFRASLPTLPVPASPVDPDFATRSEIARHAKGAVVGQLNRIRLSSRTTAAVHASLNGGVWQRIDGCRVRAIGTPADTVCTYVITACAVGSGFEWTETADGPCLPDPEEPPFSNWVRFAGFSSADGRSGSGETFVSGTTLVEEAWTWEQEPDRDATVWTFRKGRSSPSNFQGRLRWDRSDPSLYVGEFEWEAGTKWQAEIAVDGTAGVMTLLELDRGTGSWRAFEEIRWEPAHGTWSFYDTNGGLVEERVW